MIIYLFTTYLISLTGALCYYFFADKQLSFIQRKYWIYGFLAFSFILPLLSTGGQPFEFENKNSFHITSVVAEKVGINKAGVENVTGQACSMAQQCSAVIFRESGLMNIFLNYEDYIWTSFVLISALLVMLILFRIVYLFYLTRSLNRKPIDIEGKLYYLLCVDRDTGPGSFRLWHRYILWTPDLDRLSREERTAILMHEISHLEQNSTWEKLVLYGVQVFWLLNPAFYYFRRELQKLGEYIADQAVLRKTDDPKQYASLLVKLKEQSTLSLAHSFTGNSLKERILHILYPKKLCTKSSYVKIAVALSLLVLTTVYGQWLAQKQAKAIENYEQLYQMHITTGDSQFCELEGSS